MYRLLAAVDDDHDRSARIVDAITDLGTSVDELEVVLLNVFEDVQAVGEEGAIHSSAVYDESQFPDSVGEAADALGEAGIDVTKRREHGDVVDRIVGVAEEIDANCIVLCGRRRRPTGKAIFGSVAQDVLLTTDRPVLVTMDK